jgi:enamine deaminase RidA (YjgF/YER057c/UK114 family)
MTTIRTEDSMPIERIDPGRRFAQAVVHGDTVYLAGHTSSHPDAGVYEQTREILAAIDGHLATAGTNKSKLLSASIWLPDIATFDEMNRAWDEWVDPANLPARATVEARLASTDYKVEIAIIAAR